MLLESGATFYNPDVQARLLRQEDSELSQYEANSVAWTHGMRMLTCSIDTDRDYAFETTLAGDTITTELKRAGSLGHRLVIWYVGLATVEDNIRRVHQRHAQGGHDIPETTIRERYVKSPINLLRLMDVLTNLTVFDNTLDRNARTSRTPAPIELLRVRERALHTAVPVDACPAWARPVLERAHHVFAA